MVTTDSYGTLILSGEDRNAEYLGLFVAWLVSNHLLAASFQQSHGRAIASVCMQEMTGPAFLTTQLHGEITAAQLSDEGRRFADHYLKGGQFRAVYDAARYEGEDEWLRYAEVSPQITAAFRKWRGGPLKSVRKSARIFQFPGRKR